MARTVPSQAEMTISDEPTLSAALSATLAEQSLKNDALAREIRSLEEKVVLKEHKAPAYQRLPTPVVLKIKRNSERSEVRIKTPVVAEAIIKGL